jgi:hypothetical protein
MRIRAQHKTTGEPRKPTDGATPAAPRGKRPARLRPPWQPCLLLAGYLLMAALGGAALYLWRAPLPPLAASETAENRAAAALTAGRTGSRASLEACLRQVKVRELFKPSVPVPSENRLGQTTAQELAGRLQFLGTVGSAGDLAALVFIPNRGPGTFRVGERVAEFVLKAVKPDSLVLGLGDEEATLKR